MGFAATRLPGSQVHDAIEFDAGQRDQPNLGFVRPTNHAGGLEGGMTNGQTLVVRGAMKPISTLMRGLRSVNLKTLAPEHSDYERSDVCAVPAASVVAENVVAFEVARAWLDKFGGDTLREVRAAIRIVPRGRTRIGISAIWPSGVGGATAQRQTPITSRSRVATAGDWGHLMRPRGSGCGP